MKLCIVSDSHDNRSLLAAAAEDACRHGASALLHCGDIVAPTTLRVLLKLDIPVHVIHGNNTGDILTLCNLSREHPNIIYHGQDADLLMAERRVFAVHYPHYARAMALTGDYDIVCCGHAHRSSVQTVQTIKNTTTRLLNPGTVGGVGADPTYILADLETLEFTVCKVPVDPQLVVNRAPASKH